MFFVCRSSGHGGLHHRGPAGEKAAEEPKGKHADEGPGKEDTEIGKQAAYETDEQHPAAPDPVAQRTQHRTADKAGHIIERYELGHDNRRPGEVHDEEWQERNDNPDPEAIEKGYADHDPELARG